MPPKTKHRKSTNQQPKCRQLKFNQASFKSKDFFGGSLLKSNAKKKRPLSTKHPLHLVLRSDYAKGSKSLRHHASAIRKIIKNQAKNFHIKIYNFSNAGNHLHLLIYLKSNSHTQARKHFNSFTRAVTGLIARLVLKSERGTPSKIKNFWTFKLFTRIVRGWKKALKVAQNYILQNELETLKIIPYQKRKPNRAYG